MSTCKPRPISGNLPFDAIAKDYNRYCGRIVGNGGTIFSILDLFNGFNSGTLFSGGPTSVLDYLTNPITSPSGTPGIEGVRFIENLLLHSEFENGLADVNAKSTGVTITTMDGFNGAILFPSSSAQTEFVYSGDFLTTPGQTYIFSAYVELDVIDIPVGGSNGTDPTVDVLCRIGGVTATTFIGANYYSGNIYKLSWLFEATLDRTSNGLIQFLPNSGRGFSASGYSMERYQPSRQEIDSEYKTTTTSIVSDFSPDNRKFNVACWGDSLTLGLGGVQYPSVMTVDFNGSLIYNGGVSSDTSTQIKDRFLAKLETHAGVIVIWSGRNNYTAPATVKADIATMIADLPHDRYIVMSVLNSDASDEFQGQPNYDTIIQLNADLETLYGSKYLDIRSLLVAEYDPEDAADVIDHSNDVPPGTLRSDSLHLNSDGYKFVSGEVAAVIDAFGWSTSGQESIFDYTSVNTHKGVIRKYEDAFIGYCNEAGTDLTRLTDGVVFSNDQGIIVRVYPDAAGQTAVLWGSYIDVDNYTQISATPTGLLFTKVKDGGIPVSASVLFTHSTTPFIVMVHQASVNGMNIRVKQDGGAWSAYGVNADIVDMEIAADYQVGGINDTSHFVGNFPFVEFVKGDISLTEDAAGN